MFPKQNCKSARFAKNRNQLNNHDYLFLVLAQANILRIQAPEFSTSSREVSFFLQQKQRIIRCIVNRIGRGNRKTSALFCRVNPISKLTQYFLHFFRGLIYSLVCLGKNEIPDACKFAYSKLEKRTEAILLCICFTRRPKEHHNRSFWRYNHQVQHQDFEKRLKLHVGNFNIKV